MSHLQIFGVLVLLSVAIGLALNHWSQKRPPKSVVREVKSRPPSEVVTLPQSQPINQTISSTTPYGPVRPLRSLDIPIVVEEEQTESWPPTPPKGAA